MLKVNRLHVELLVNTFTHVGRHDQHALEETIARFGAELVFLL